MQLKFFTIAMHGGDETEAELNRFLTSHRIIAVDRQFVSNGANSSWSVCVSFDEGSSGSGARAAMPKRGKVDFRDILTDAEFAVFARLRASRKERADAEGIPAYAVFTNEQLAEMVQKRITSATALREIPGVGVARADKYGPAVLPILQAAGLPETPVSDHET